MVTVTGWGVVPNYYQQIPNDSVPTWSTLTSWQLAPQAPNLLRVCESRTNEAVGNPVSAELGPTCKVWTKLGWEKPSNLFNKKNNSKLENLPVSGPFFCVGYKMIKTKMFGFVSIFLESNCHCRMWMYLLIWRLSAICSWKCDIYFQLEYQQRNQPQCTPALNLMLSETITGWPTYPNGCPWYFSEFWIGMLANLLDV